jgi:hypothetical protein
LKYFAKLLMKVNNIVIPKARISDHPARAIGMGCPTPAQMPPDTLIGLFSPVELHQPLPK